MSIHVGTHYVNGRQFNPNPQVETTKFFDDFLLYYRKAEVLQNRNEGKEDPNIIVNDPLMMNVHIYDCIERRQAGFSNMLQDIHGKRSPKKEARIPELKYQGKEIRRFLHLIHRFTGSGASFESDHGYRNSILPKLVEFLNHVYDRQPTRSPELLIRDCISIILRHEGPTVTSIGNQPPSLKNPDKLRYRLAQHFYFDKFAYQFIMDYSAYLENQTVGIKDAVDFSLKWHKTRGFKQWKFIMTAFVMDDAEYYPKDVEPNSHCYYGPNCIKAFQLMFDRPEGKRIKNDEYYEMCMQYIVDFTGGQPYSLEDVCCDMIRYWTEYLPKNGYEHLTEQQRSNNSKLKVDGQYHPSTKARLRKVIGYSRHGE